MSNKKTAKKLNMDNIGKFVYWYKRLPSTQKTALMALAFMAVVIPASVYATLSEINTQSKAYKPVANYRKPSASALPKAPILLTKEMAPARINIPYEFTFKSTVMTESDQNPTMTITGLPEGITVKNCRAYSKLPTKLDCQLTGKTTHSGTFTIVVTVNDGTDTNLVRKDFQFQVLDQNGRSPTPKPHPTPSSK